MGTNINMDLENLKKMEAEQQSRTPRKVVNKIPLDHKVDANTEKFPQRSWKCAVPREFKFHRNNLISLVSPK